MSIVQVETFSDLLADLSDKVGETVADASDNRKRKINNAYFYIASKRNWWWKEATQASNTPADLTTTSLSYPLPTNFGVWVEHNPVKVGTSTYYNIIPFSDRQLYDGTASTVSLPQALGKSKAYTYAGYITFIQSSMTAGQVISYWYYKLVLGLDETDDEPLMPIQFREIISLYAAGMQMLSSGGKEAEEGKTYLKLYDDYLKQMEAFDDTRHSTGIKRRTRDPEEAMILNR